MRFQKNLVIFLIISSFFSLIVNHVLANNRARCHDHEKAALLEFKHSFLIDCTISAPTPFSPRTISWQDVNDCCTWDGVKCDKDTHYVIGLDLSSSCLYGTFPSNGTLFSLDHLLELDLSYNDFQNSPIPSSISRLYTLRSLFLSRSRFGGLVPPEMSLLSNLAELDLSDNVGLVFAAGNSFDKLVTNMTRLTRLFLDSVDISSVVPPILGNITSLTAISLSNCQLYGEFPQGNFQLPRLQELSIYDNQRLEGRLPEFHPNSSLRELELQVTGLSGKIPSSIGNLGRLTYLAANKCSFYGRIPASLGKLTKLTTLSLSFNGFSGPMPSSLTNLTTLDTLSLSGLDVSPVILDSWLLKLKELTWLVLTKMNMGTKIPSNLANLTKLNHLNLEANQLFGTLPQWFANLTQLTDLYLGVNKLEGSVQPWLSKLINLNDLDLSSTNFVGTIDQFLKLPKIQNLYLSNLNLTILPYVSTNSSSLPNLSLLYLDSCNLTEFPQFLKHQNELSHLSLANNHIRGHVPRWFMDTAKESLFNLNLSSNSLVGFDQSQVALPWTNLEILDLSSNNLQGLLPIPSNTVQIYDISNNQLHGAIPKQICRAQSLIILDLSNNSMGGQIPQCIGHQLGNSLLVLNLRENNFQGIIPQRFHNSCTLKMINLSDNRLEGWLPRSLGNCTMLEVLDLGKNRLNDTFPSWLGSIATLQVLVLRHNSFHGKIREDPESSFRRLRIMDLSHNLHVGTLPSSYLLSWHAMQVTGEGRSSSSHSSIMISKQPMFVYDTSNYVITITYKGSETLYPKILSVFRLVDFSSNNFTGKISRFFGDLKGIQALNLSNNHLQGNIPLSLSKMKDLETLDLSQNTLSGVIPQELTELTFLAVFNVSHNQLVGPIPLGEQFNTFDNSSFDGNLALCGAPLSKKCKLAPPSPAVPSQQETDDEAEDDMISWIIRALGCASGLIVGFVIGKLYITDRYHGWFMKTFARKRKMKPRGKKALNQRRIR